MIENRPTGLRRHLLRAPVHLYRAGFGRLLGERFVYLVHTGRTSGLRRDTVLEVVHYDASVPEVFVVAGWGRRSDWLRNIEASPPVEIRIGRAHWLRPSFRLLDPEELTAVLNDYRQRHPRAWGALAPRMGLDPASPDAGVDRAAHDFPGVAFRP